MNLAGQVIVEPREELVEFERRLTDWKGRPDNATAMPQLPLVSVETPVIKAGWLVPCIESVLSQTSNRWQLSLLWDAGDERSRPGQPQPGTGQRAFPFIRPFVDLAAPRPRAALPFALVERLPVSFPSSSATRPTSLSSLPSALLRLADFAILGSFSRCRSWPRSDGGSQTSA